MHHLSFKEVVVVGSKWTPLEVRREAVARVVAGEAVAEVAASLGTHKNNVWQWLKTAGVLPPKKAKAAANDALFVEAKTLLAQGVSQARAAEAVGMDSGALSYRLRQESATAVVGVKHSTAEEREYALAQVRAGRNPKQVAKELGRSDYAVYEWMDKAGVQGPRGSRKHFAKKRAEALDLAGKGWPAPQIADTLGVHESSVYLWLKNEVMTSTRPLAVSRQPSQAGQKVGRGTCLSTVDRIRIAEGVTAGRSAREIGRQIGRHHTVVKREIERNGITSVDPDGSVTTYYNVERAEELTAKRKRRPKPRKIDVYLPLRQEVLDGLARRWSPKRIERRLRSCYPDDGTMHISHESIYSAIYIQGAGSLRKELEDYIKDQQALIRGGAQRKPRKRTAGLLTNRRGWVKGAEITTRPPEVDDRAIFGHWEGDLVIGKNGKSALITLVERTTRFTLLGHLPDEHSSKTVVETIQDMVQDLNREQLKTITWDQGVEMAMTARVKIAEDCAVYFCDPHSPWQRPTNENTNGEIRRRFYPKTTDFKEVTAEHVAWVQDELNDTPRVIFDGKTPREMMQQLAQSGAFIA